MNTLRCYLGVMENAKEWPLILKIVYFWKWTLNICKIVWVNWMRCSWIVWLGDKHIHLIIKLARWFANCIYKTKANQLWCEGMCMYRGSIADTIVDILKVLCSTPQMVNTASKNLQILERNVSLWGFDQNDWFDNSMAYSLVINMKRKYFKPFVDQ